ncbi:hypothetical protein MUB15_14810 [Priestia sp. OVS21]|nr:hypothetical protein [Priestia sp. OVS21]
MLYFVSWYSRVYRQSKQYREKTASIQTDQTYPNVEIQTLVKDLTDGGYAISYPSFGKKKSINTFKLT